MEIHTTILDGEESKPVVFKLRDMLMNDARFYTVASVFADDPPTWGAAFYFRSGGELRVYFENERHWAHTRDRIDRMLKGQRQRAGDDGIIEIAQGAIHWEIHPDAKGAEE